MKKVIQSIILLIQWSLTCWMFSLSITLALSTRAVFGGLFFDLISCSCRLRRLIKLIKNQYYDLVFYAYIHIPTFAQGVHTPCVIFYMDRQDLTLFFYLLHLISVRHSNHINAWLWCVYNKYKDKWFSIYKSYHLEGGLDTFSYKSSPNILRYDVCIFCWRVLIDIPISIS